MTYVSAGHIIATPTQPVGSGRPQRETNPGPLYQKSRALPTELPPPPPHTHTQSKESRLESVSKTKDFKGLLADGTNSLFPITHVSTCIN